jgi:hypothetical protein
MALPGRTPVVRLAGEGVGAVEGAVRGVVEGPVAVQAEDSVGWAGDEDDRQGVPVRVAVVPYQRASV